MDIKRIDVKKRYSEIVIHNQTVYLSGQVPWEYENDDFITQTEEVFNLVEKQLHKITILFYNLLNDVENNYALLLGSRLYDHIMDIINSDTTFAFLSTHDNSIMPFLKYIHKKYNKDSFIDLPDFCSTVRFEIWSSENIRVLKIYYDTILIVEININ